VLAPVREPVPEELVQLVQREVLLQLEELVPLEALVQELVPEQLVPQPLSQLVLEDWQGDWQVGSQADLLEEQLVVLAEHH